MYKKLISPKVYSKETDLTYKTPKEKKKVRTTPSSGGNTPTPPTPPISGSFILLEDGFYMLTEDNFKFIL